MKSLIAFSIIAVAAIFAVGCTANQQAQDEEKTPKSLVLYYSQTGTTKAVAEEIQLLTGADIQPIELEDPYDGDFTATIARVQQEQADSVLPTVKPFEVNVDDYDTIYLGYPIWFGTYAPPIASLLEKQDFTGKTVIPFCTFGSGGLEASASHLKQAQPKAVIAEGYGVRTARMTDMPAELDRFMKENGYIEGEVEPLPEFSEQETVTEAETAIFDAACGNYQFPLGKPLSFGKRTTATGTDYKFMVDNQTVIYVTVKNGEKATPEFTRVVR